jgi:hypothetical protein
MNTAGSGKCGWSYYDPPAEKSPKQRKGLRYPEFGGAYLQRIFILSYSF